MCIRDSVSVIKNICRTEGLLLDPLYTAKAFMGLVDLVRRGYIPKESNVVFIHTGGTPLIFQFNDVLQTL